MRLPALPPAFIQSPEHPAVVQTLRVGRSQLKSSAPPAEPPLLDFKVAPAVCERVRFLGQLLPPTVLALAPLLPALLEANEECLPFTSACARQV